MQGHYPGVDGAVLMFYKLILILRYNLFLLLGDETRLVSLLHVKQENKSLSTQVAQELWQVKEEHYGNPISA